MNSRRRLVSLAGAVLLVGTGCAHSRLKSAKGLQGEIVVAEGLAPYHEDDLPGTQAASLAAAQRSAVELVVGVYVNAKTRVEKAVAIQNSILTNSQGYVKRYEILSEGRSGDWYKTRIRALVSTQEIHEQLDQMGLLREPSVGYPRVAIDLQEYIGESEAEGKPASQALADALLKQGFRVMDLPKPIPAGTDAVEAAKGLHNSAELLIAGLARAQSLGYTSKQLGGMSSFRASVSFRVIESGSGEIVQTVSETASGLEGTPDIAGAKALRQAAELAAGDLTGLPQELEKRAHVMLTITGLKSFETLAKFQKDLAAQGGVKDLYLRSYQQDSGVAVLDVLTDQLSPQDVADASVRLGGPEWSVYQVAGRSVQLAASQAGR